MKSKMENANAERRSPVSGCKDPMVLYQSPSNSRGSFTHLLLIVSTFLIIALIPPVSAGNESINFNHPSSASCGEKFSVSIDLAGFSEGSYDIKIDLLNSDGTRIAQILNNGAWKSTYYYIDSAINSSSPSGTFDMNITKEYSGTASINVTLRKGSSLYKFGGYSIDVSIPTSPVPPVEQPVENTTGNTNVTEETDESVQQNRTEGISENQSAESDVGETKTIEESSKKTVAINTAKAVSVPKETSEFSVSDNGTESEEPVKIEMKDDRIREFSIYLLTGTLLVSALYLIRLKFFV